MRKWSKRNLGGGGGGGSKGVDILANIKLSQTLVWSLTRTQDEKKRKKKRSQVDHCLEANAGPLDGAERYEKQAKVQPTSGTRSSMPAGFFERALRKEEGAEGGKSNPRNGEEAVNPDDFALQICRLAGVPTTCLPPTYLSA